MDLFICIDDTDNLDSIGTGQVLENLIDALRERGLAKGSFVTRHQLLIHPDIPYTSHNSSMCCAASTDRPDETAAFCCTYMSTHCAEGSDPGLCIAIPERLGSAKPLLDFGRRAKTAVLSKADAYDLASQCGGGVLLSEHGGTGDGVIGALAGCGLRMGGNDGRIKGKLRPDAAGEVLTAADFCRKYHVDQVLDPDNRPVGPGEQMVFRAQSKALYRNFLRTVIAAQAPEDGGLWHPLSKMELPKVWMD